MQHSCKWEGSERQPRRQQAVAARGKAANGKARCHKMLSGKAASSKRQAQYRNSTDNKRYDCKREGREWQPTDVMRSLQEARWEVARQEATKLSSEITISEKR